ncbi:MAG: 1-deoxy-D-xylulose-5-phosphate reductoisomerase [Candidatus Margulisbacteria bacterium]|nr:1-deoxy-D-xylulose-5-phosphate reductoisomerase [Candidatus Margulisiibacteriota bacterium]
MKKISILGSTGSIGTQALEVIAQAEGLYEVVGLAARGNIDLLEKQIKKFNPQVVSMIDEEKSKELRKRISNKKIEILFGDEGLKTVATHPAADQVLVAVTGVATLGPTLEAIKKKKDIALASKEILVSAGHIVMEEVKVNGVKIIPVDSEHSAIMQALSPTVNKKGFLDYHIQEVEKLILTASGGPFFRSSEEDLGHIKPQDALAHPTWNMGKKVTLDSATLFNKGLEVIEAHWLFGVPYKKIQVLIHTQSIVHSMAEFVDGSVIAQLGLPDMRMPISYAFAYPRRFAGHWPKLELHKISELTFYEPDLKKFPALKLAYIAGEEGGTMPTVLNAANERAVELFLEERIKFTDIAKLIEKTMEKHDSIKNAQIKDIVFYHAWARNKIDELVKLPV